jgi:hypothetical protein
MSFGKRVKKGFNPKNLLNPAKAHIEGFKKGGISGFVDPYETFGDNQKKTKLELDAIEAKKDKSKKVKSGIQASKGQMSPKGFAAGGLARGMGAAIKGGKFRKDG